MPQAAVSQAFTWDWLNGCFFFALWFLFFLPLKNYQRGLGWTYSVEKLTCFLTAN